MGMSSAVRVSIRVRPLNRREADLNAKCAISVEGTSCTAVINNEAKTFGYDECFWSVDKTDATFASQEKVFNSIGRQLLQHSVDGYNCCLMAYGQTGAGKSYSMMGSRKAPGLIPQIATDLFERAAERNAAESIQTEIEVSYMEIYCEKVRDLLGKKNEKPLRVREHPALGPYVEGLKKLAATTQEEALQLMATGNAARTVAATNMNATSSRSHAVFQIFIKQKKVDENGVVDFEKKSKIALIDLAGSERASTSGTAGTRLKEGGSINKSLTTLGKVIHALSEKKKHVPYRESILTWLLKDSLGGNSRTWVLAAISPADDCVEETISTLRWADRARRVQCHAVVNENPTTKLISALRAEIAQLKSLMEEPKEGHNSAEVEDMLTENQRLVGELEQNWDEKVDQSKKIIEEKVVELESLGVISGRSAGLCVPKKPHLVNLSPDPLLSECLLYVIGVDNATRVGRAETADIKLEGEGVLEEHAIFTGTQIQPSCAEAQLFVNGKQAPEGGIELKHGDRIIFGKTHVFRFSTGASINQALEVNTSDIPDSVSLAGTEINFDWEQAQRELLDEAGIDMEKEMEKQLLCFAEEAYRREKQKAENGDHDPAETSWRLIKALRDRLQPGQVQKIVKKAGVIEQAANQKEETKSQAEAAWVTMADVKLQAVKELCYEVALGDFDMDQDELEKLAKNITNAVTLRWGKTDPSFEDSWRSVLRDAAETIGLDVNISEPEVENLEKKKEMDKLVAKLDEVSRREQIKDMELAQLRAKVVAQETGQYTSHKFVRSKEFDRPSPGVIVPGHLDGQHRIDWLMENDQAFRRGRLRWEKSQKIYQENLAKREVNKAKRKEVADTRKVPTKLNSSTDSRDEVSEERHAKPSPGVKFNTDVEVKFMTSKSPSDKRRKRRPRSSHNRPRSASRDRKSPEPVDDFVINLDFYDSIPGAVNDNNDGRTSRTRNQSNKQRGMHRAKSQGATPRPLADQENGRHQGQKAANLTRQNSMPSENGGTNSNKLEKYRQRAKQRDDYDVEPRAPRTPQAQRRHKSRHRSPNRVQNNLPVHLRDDYHDYYEEPNTNNTRINDKHRKVRESVGKRKDEHGNDRYHDYHDHRSTRNKHKHRDQNNNREHLGDREVIVTPDRPEGHSPGNGQGLSPGHGQGHGQGHSPGSGHYRGRGRRSKPREIQMYQPPHRRGSESNK